jgi:hypothetical protein
LDTPERFAILTKSADVLLFKPMIMPLHNAWLDNDTARLLVQACPEWMSHGISHFHNHQLALPGSYIAMLRIATL